LHFTIDHTQRQRQLGGMFAAIALLLIVVAYRIVLGIAGSADLQWLHNFSPVAAIALCGAVYLPRRIAWTLPIAMLLLSDIVLNVFHYRESLFTWNILPRYFALASIVALGFALRDRVRLAGLLAGSVAGSIIFYLVTNTGSWIADPGYAKTATGWLQAMTTGLPGFPPTWWFYRHTLFSDLLFTVLFFTCVRLTSRAPAAAGLRQSAQARAA
jgi:hypothetical protein